MNQRQLCSLPVLLACLAAPASGADAPDPSQLTVDRIFGQQEEFKVEDWGPAYWLKDSSGYTTLEVAERFKDSGGTHDAKSIKDIVRYAPGSGQRDILVAAESLIPPGQSKPLPIEDYAWSDDANKVLLFTNTKRVSNSSGRRTYADCLCQLWLGRRWQPGIGHFGAWLPHGTKTTGLGTRRSQPVGMSSGLFSRNTRCRFPPHYHDADEP